MTTTNTEQKVFFKKMRRYKKVEIFKTQRKQVDTLENWNDVKMMNIYECEPVSCALVLFWSGQWLWMTVGCGAYVQVSTHSQDHCAHMSEVFKLWRSVIVCNQSMNLYMPPSDKANFAFSRALQRSSNRSPVQAIWKLLHCPDLGRSSLRLMSESWVPPGHLSAFLCSH